MKEELIERVRSHAAREGWPFVDVAPGKGILDDICIEAWSVGDEELRGLEETFGLVWFTIQPVDANRVRILCFQDGGAE